MTFLSVPRKVARPQPGEARIDLSRRHANLSLPPKRPIAIPVVTRVVEMSVDGDFDGGAIAARLTKAALAFPILAGRIEIGVWRDLNGHTGLIGLAETALALPAVVI